MEKKRKEENVKKITIDTFVRYSNHQVKDNGIVDLCLKAQYSCLDKVVLCSQMLNENISIKTMIKKQSLSLGSFRIKRIIIDSDGESKLYFVSSSDAVQLDNLNKVAIESEMEEFKIRFEANILKEEREE